MNVKEIHRIINMHVINEIFTSRNVNRMQMNC